MLVLSRKLGERIVIPDCDLEVTVVGIVGKRVRLAISAPAAVGVYREEVWLRRGQQLTNASIQEQGRGRNNEAG
jgi:carbon storage regulator CsrA